MAGMAHKSYPKTLLWSLAPLVLLGVYVATYFLSTEVFHGAFGSTRYRIRLFQSVWHQRVFSPLLAAEEKLRPANPEFSGQVHNGASLPPPDESEE
jgi:hypothetical protein